MKVHKKLYKQIVYVSFNTTMRKIKIIIGMVNRLTS